MKYSTKELVLASATAVGAFGGFPEPPKFFTDLVILSDSLHTKI